MIKIRYKYSQQRKQSISIYDAALKFVFEYLKVHAEVNVRSIIYTERHIHGLTDG